MDLTAISKQLTDAIGLSSAPIALSFLDEVPRGIMVFDSKVPSACTFWTRAEKGLFFAGAEDHENCPVGTLTMGFPLHAKVMSSLQEFVAKMCHAAYIGAKEPESIPRYKNGKKGILYGPLGIFPQKPDLCLIWVNGRQAMLLEEALGMVCWDAIERSEAFGRPACAALAITLNENRTTLSFGCSGMRTFTDIGDDLLLLSIPGAMLETLSERLRATMNANEEMLSFYRQHRQQFPAST